MQNLPNLFWLKNQRADLLVSVSTVSGGDGGEDDDSDVSQCKMYVEAESGQRVHTS